MTDPELDDLLRRYRPAAPPPGLRARVLDGDAVDTRRAWPWAAAAAALLVAVGLLQLSTRDVYRALAVSVSANEASDLDNVPALRSAVDDDELLRRLVDALARLERQEAAAAQSPSGPSWQ
jgi:hypothetical protein